MNVQIIVDNKNSWIISYAQKLNIKLLSDGHVSELIHDHNEIKTGDVLFLLSCEKILSKELMSLHKHNLVIHESDLPKGKGWSPVTWQILEGQKIIPVTLFEAVEGVDAGPIYLQENIEFNGLELIDEIRFKQGEKTIELAYNFVKNYRGIKSKSQEGESTFYKRRRPEDSRIDIEKSVREQFNLLRVCDNERYPAFFEIDGQRFILKIFKEGKK